MSAAEVASWAEARTQAEVHARSPCAGRDLSTNKARAALEDLASWQRSRAEPAPHPLVTLSQHGGMEEAGVGGWDGRGWGGWKRLDWVGMEEAWGWDGRGWDGRGWVGMEEAGLGWKRLGWVEEAGSGGRGWVGWKRLGWDGRGWVGLDKAAGVEAAGLGRWTGYVATLGWVDEDG
jgi:hypothetical protein